MKERLMYKNLHFKMKECKLSDEELAVKVRRTVRTIYNWRIGKNNPTPTDQKFVATYLGVDVDWLFEFRK